jgi:hypothetical protein
MRTAEFILIAGAAVYAYRSIRTRKRSGDR